jgi:hypothetical protein
MKVEVGRFVVSLGREGLGAEVEGATGSEWRVYKVGARSQIRVLQKVLTTVVLLYATMVLWSVAELKKRSSVWHILGLAREFRNESKCTKKTRL